MQTSNHRKSLIAVLTISLMTGCAKPLPTPMAGPPPWGIVKELAHIKVEKFQPGFGSLPLGAYQIPNTSVIISDFNRASTMPPAIFGALGAIIANETGKQAAAGALQQDTSYLVELEAFTRNMLANKLKANAQYVRLSLNENKLPRYTLRPDIWIETGKDNKVRVGVWLLAELTDASGNPMWHSSYMGTRPTEDRPLTGDGGWLGPNTSYLKEATEHALDDALTKFLNAASS